MKLQSQIRENKIKYTTAILTVLLIGLGCSTNLQAQQLMVEERVIVKAPVKAVWALIGGFQVLDRWHPAVFASALIGTGKDWVILEF